MLVEEPLVELLPVLEELPDELLEPPLVLLVSLLLLEVSPLPVFDVLPLDELELPPLVVFELLVDPEPVPLLVPVLDPVPVLLDVP